MTWLQLVESRDAGYSSGVTKCPANCSVIFFFFFLLNGAGNLHWDLSIYWKQCCGAGAVWCRAVSAGNGASLLGRLRLLPFNNKNMLLFRPFFTKNSNNKKSWVHICCLNLDFLLPLRRILRLRKNIFKILYRYFYLLKSRAGVAFGFGILKAQRRLVGKQNIGCILS